MLDENITKCHPFFDFFSALKVSLCWKLLSILWSLALAMRIRDKDYISNIYMLNMDGSALGLVPSFSYAFRNKLE